ncbi:MAG: two-component regulator propeller domain-containing protein [Bacteroidota bacterium]
MPGLVLRLSCPRLVLALLCLSSVARAQPNAGVRFEVPPPGTLSGTPTVVYDIAQAPSGHLWVASEQGLHRYDGVEFVAYRADPDDPRSMPGNRVTSLSIAPDGSVWAGVDRFGLVRIDPDGRLDARYRLPDSTHVDPHVRVDGQGQVWLTHGGWDQLGDTPPGQVLYAFDPEAAALRPVVRDVDPWGAEVGPDGTLWVRARGSLLQHAGGRWTRHLLPDGAELVAGRAMGVLTASGRMFLFDPEAGRFRRTPADLSAIGAATGGYRRWIDASGTLWSSAYAEETLVAVHLASGRTRRYEGDPTRSTSLPGYVSEMFQDREGVLWFGTSRGLRTVRSGWAVFRSHALPPLVAATVLAPARQGGAWMGTLCSEPSLLLPSGETRTLTEVNPAVGAAYGRVGHCSMDVVEATDGTFWFAGWPEDRRGGLLKIAASGEATLYRADASDPSAIPNDAMRHVHEDSQGRIWVASEAGLARYDPEADAFVRYPIGPDEQATSERPSIWAIEDGPDGRLWVSVYGGGLVYLDPQSGERAYHYPDPDVATSLSSPNVTVIHASRQEAGVLWLGTYDGGLNRMEVATGEVRRFTLQDGLPDLSIKSILEDETGRLWLTTGTGLVRFDPEAEEVGVYTEADGLPGTQFGLYDGADLGDGQFAFALSDRAVRFDPLIVEPTLVNAPVVLRQLQVLGQPRAVPPQGEPIRLGASERSFGVEVAALSFQAPDRLRYEVRLEGVDDEWVPLGDQRTASWARVPPGEHVLQARAGTASGGWSPQVLSIPVAVAPRWWERRSVQVAAGVLLLLGFAAAVRAVSQRRLRRRVEALEEERRAAARLQHERERISRDLHDNVGAQLSSLIAGVELARLARDAGGDGASDPLDAVEDDARTTMRQLRETIWMLHDKAVPVRALCTRLGASLAPRNSGTPAVSVALEGGDEVDLPPMVALNLYRIAQEAVTNARKHAGASRIEVLIACEPGAVTLRVTDDGAFRNPEAAPTGLSGFGMRSMRARAEEMGAALDLDTSDGTRVTVTVALAPDAEPEPNRGPSPAEGRV